jgi:SnoaL-like polyketide cyclase
MSTEENKTILRASYEAIFNQHEVDRAGEFYAPDYLDHDGLPGQAPGLEGELLGISATGKPFRLSGMSIYRLAEGKITEQREWWDRLALMRQLGVLPNPGGN